MPNTSSNVRIDIIADVPGQMRAASIQPFVFNARSRGMGNSIYSNSLNSPSSFSNHIPIHLEKNVQTSDFRDDESLHTSNDSLDSEQSSFKYNVCRKTLSFLKHLKELNLTQAGEKSFSPTEGMTCNCHVCKDVFSASQKLDQNEKMSFKPCVSKEMLSTIQELEKHTNKAVSFNSDVSKDGFSTSQKLEKHQIEMMCFQPDVGKEVLSTSQELKKHTSEEMPFKSKVSMEHVSTSEDLKKHTTDEVPVDCKVRFVPFPDVSPIQEHTFLNFENPFQCSKCLSFFVSSHDLELHTCSVPLEIKPFRCSVCEKSFSTSHLLCFHIFRNCNKNVKKYKCNDCEKSFTRRYALNRHSALHTRKMQTNLECHVCRSSFRSVQELNWHFCSPSQKEPLKYVKPFRATSQVKVLHTSLQLDLKPHNILKHEEDSTPLTFTSKGSLKSFSPPKELENHIPIRSKGSLKSFLSPKVLPNDIPPPKKAMTFDYNVLELSSVDDKPKLKVLFEEGGFESNLGLKPSLILQEIQNRALPSISASRDTEIPISSRSKEKLVECRSCLKTFRSSSGVEKRKCVECRKSKLSISKGRNTVVRQSEHDSYSNSGEPCFKCLKCCKTYKSQSSLDSHISLRHSARKAFNCHGCDEAFSSMYELLSHFPSHNNTILFNNNTLEMEIVSKVDKLEKHAQREVLKEKTLESGVNSKPPITSRILPNYGSSQDESIPLNNNIVLQKNLSSGAVNLEKNVMKEKTFEFEITSQELENHTSSFNETMPSKSNVLEESLSSSVAVNLEKNVMKENTSEFEITSQELENHTPSFNETLPFKNNVVEKPLSSSVADNVVEQVQPELMKESVVNLKSVPTSQAFHGKGTAVEILLPGKSLSLADNLEPNERKQTKHKMFDCYVRLEKFRTPEELKGYYLSHSKNLSNLSSKSDDRFKCTRCSTSFRFFSIMRQHMLRAHGEPSRYECTECLEKFSTSKEYRDHNLLHSKGPSSKLNDRFACSVCLKSFPFFNKMRYHMKDVHGKVLKYECTKCLKIFLSLEGLKHHTSAHRKVRPSEAKSRSSNSKRRSSEPKPKFKCTVCSKTFKFFSTMKSHMNEEHGETIEYECNNCEKKFSSLKGLKIHESGHIPAYKRDFQCSIPECTKAYIHFRSLRSHLKKDHPEVEINVCAPCSKVFLSSQEFENHKASSHAEVAPSTSTSTPKPNVGRMSSFSFSKDMTKTQSESPIGNAPEIISISKRVRSRNNDLSYESLQRLRKLSGPPTREVLLTCPVCLKLFPSNSCLMTHMHCHAQGGKLFKCTECLVLFTHARFLLAHLYTHLGIYKDPNDFLISPYDL